MILVFIYDLYMSSCNNIFSKQARAHLFAHS